jgi:uncharacterized membrane-anchored protein
MVKGKSAMKRMLALLALVFPLLFLSFVVMRIHFLQMPGEKIILPIVGNDPRDLLSGHYLQFRLNYPGGEPQCNFFDKDSDVYVCLRGDSLAYERSYPSIKEVRSNNCKLYIRGQCNNGHFVSGIEQFFVPEAYATVLQKAVLNKQGKVVLRVQYDGTATLENLLIDGMPWQDYVKRQTP